MTKPSPFRENFACFLEEPTRDRLREVLKEQFGEFHNLDFKADWPEDAKLAKHILGMANSGGGCLVLGVSETPSKTHQPTGLAHARDKADFQNGLQGILPAALLDQMLVLDFQYAASEYPALVGKIFQTVIVPDDPQNLPFLAAGETTGIRRTEIYIRRMASTAPATYEEIQEILNRRIATGHSTQHALGLNQHLEDLRKLYLQLEIFYRQNPMGGMSAGIFQKQGLIMVGNKIMAKESFDDFLNRMIVFKKRQVEQALGF